MPSLTVALRGLFGGGMARCLDRCLEEMTSAHENGGGVTSEPSFRTVGTSGSIGSGAGAAAAARSAARQKVRTLQLVDSTKDNAVLLTRLDV